MEELEEEILEQQEKELVDFSTNTINELIQNNVGLQRDTIKLKEMQIIVTK